MTDNPHSRLVEALLLDQPRLRGMYLTDAGFHQNIDILAAMLPAWVDGMVLHASRTSSEQRKRMQELMDFPPRLVFQENPLTDPFTKESNAPH